MASSCPKGPCIECLTYSGQQAQPRVKQRCRVKIRDAALGLTEELTTPHTLPWAHSTQHTRHMLVGLSNHTPSKAKTSRQTVRVPADKLPPYAASLVLEPSNHGWRLSTPTPAGCSSRQQQPASSNIVSLGDCWSCPCPVPALSFICTPHPCYLPPTLCIIQLCALEVAVLFLWGKGDHVQWVGS
jgi:hypothetical protein